MKLYFAGGESGDKHTLLKKWGAYKYLVSFYYTKKKWSFTPDDDVLLDSGGYTARMKGVEIDVKEYANFINDNNVKLAFELDTNSPKQTLYNRDYLTDNTRATIIPIYHLSDFEKGDKKYLYNMLDNFNFISVGGVAGVRAGKRKEKIFYDFIFSNTRDKWKVHGLGITGQTALQNYPWFSVDSTSWLQSTQYGHTACKMDKRLIKSLSYRAKEIRGTRKTEKEIENQNYLLGQDIKFYLETEKHITKLWEKRGVKWT